MKPRHPVVVITGGGGGLGRAFARALATPGRTLVIADIDRAAAERVRDEVRHLGAAAHAVRCDVRDSAALEELAEAFPDTELAIANAGILAAGPALTTPAEVFESALAINLRGVVNTCQAFAPAMVERRRGALLNVASLAGLVPTPWLGPYAASKAAVVGYSRALRAELAPAGVVVTTLCPSFTRTGLIARGYSLDPVARSLGESLFRRIGQTPEAVARAGLRGVVAGKSLVVPGLPWRGVERSFRLMPRLTEASVGWIYRAAVGARAQPEGREAGSWSATGPDRPPPNRGILRSISSARAWAEAAPSRPRGEGTTGAPAPRPRRSPDCHGTAGSPAE